MDGQRGKKRHAGSSQGAATAVKKPKTATFTCGGCKTVQPVEKFYKKQRKEGGRCKDCHDAKFQAPNSGRDGNLTDEKRQEQQQRKQEKKLKREAEEQRLLEEKRLREELERARDEQVRNEQLAKWGPQRTNLPTYAVPAGGQHHHDCPPLEFKAQVPSNEWLVGTYDLIFFSSYCVDCPSHRTTMGALELTLEKDGKLCGKVALDNSVRMGCYMHQDDVHICAERSSEDEGAELKFQITNEEDLSNLCNDLEEFPVTVQVVAKQHAVPYRPEDSDDNIEHKEAYASSIPSFADAKQAQAILLDYQQQIELKWMTRHLELPIEVIQRICSFAFYKPPPVFLYEENDLWIEFLWESDAHEGDHVSTLVARRR